MDVKNVNLLLDSKIVLYFWLPFFTSIDLSKQNRWLINFLSREKSYFR